MVTAAAPVRGHPNDFLYLPSFDTVSSVEMEGLGENTGTDALTMVDFQLACFTILSFTVEKIDGGILQYTAVNIALCVANALQPNLYVQACTHNLWVFLLQGPHQ